MTQVTSPQYTLPNTLGALWMPFTSTRSFHENPRLVVRAEGKYYFTPQNEPILDAVSGLWCSNAGHHREPIIRAIQEQAGTLDYAPSFQFGHPLAFECATRIAAMAPGDLNHVFFVNSGSEAVDTALKIALGYHLKCGHAQRSRLIGREKGYHGVGFGGISVGGIGSNRKLFGNGLAGVDHLPHTYNREQQAFSMGEPEWGAHLADELERLVFLHDASTIAAVIVEPMAGSGGAVPPPKGYLQKLRALCDKYGILLIFDEVITGFGRLGFAFAAERYGVVPDMITFAKGATSGTVPLGGVLVRTPVYEAFMDHTPRHLTELPHGYTYSAHPLGIAACLAAITLYKEEKLFENVRSLEQYWAEAVMGLKDLPLVDDIRTLGFVAGIDLTPVAGSPGLRGYKALEYAFHSAGTMVRISGDTLLLAPPLTYNTEDIDSLVGKIREVISNIAF